MRLKKKKVSASRKVEKKEKERKEKREYKKERQRYCEKKRERGKKNIIRAKKKGEETKIKESYYAKLSEIKRTFY